MADKKTPKRPAEKRAPAKRKAAPKKPAPKKAPAKRAAAKKRAAKKPQTATNQKVRDDDARGAPKGKFGNPAFVPTDAQRTQARTLAQTFPMHGEHFIAAKMGISRDTLRRHFADDMTIGRADMLASVGAQMINRALDAEKVDTNGKPIAKGDIEAQKFVLARLGGWTTKVQLGDKAAAPFSAPQVDLTRLSEDDLEEYGRLSAIAEGLDPDEVVGGGADD